MQTDERAAFTSAAAWFRGTVDEVTDRWDLPGLGEWTVRDLTGHTSRALVTVETYLDAEPGEVTVGSPSAYFAQVLQASPASVAERGREAGRALGPDPAEFLAELDTRVQGKVAAVPDDAYVATPAGGMRLIDYLPTRTFELVVHTADLAAALGVARPSPDDAAASALAVAGQLAVQRGAGVDVLLALTGRAALPAGFTVL